ncbi:PAS domain-containing protein, partial [Staphylococcus aureus]|uniref:PAS domain-containing protein n=1 Tax=Staphylococcus aureus TaxID=1280 RepID=UPI001F1A3671
MRCFPAGAPYTIEYRFLRADDGAERWLQSHGGRILAGDSRPSRFVGVSLDVTDRKRASLARSRPPARLRMVTYSESPRRAASPRGRPLRTSTASCAPPTARNAACRATAAGAAKATAGR